MNRNSIRVALIIAMTSLIYTACKDEDECRAGLGGDVELALFPKHHDKPIISQANYPDSAFLKFNTQEFPGPNPSDYDMVIAGQEGEDHVHISGLTCGEYYIYMTGFDTSINQRVTGGIPYSFTEKSGEIDVDIPVTE